jgi:hypothetical protein
VCAAGAQPSQSSRQRRPHARPPELTNREETTLVTHSAQSVAVKGFVMASKFVIGDKVDQPFSNHAEGTVVAVFTDTTGQKHYAVEMFGHCAIQIKSKGSLVAHGNPAI